MVHNSLSTVRKYLSEQSSYGSSLLNVLFFTPKQNSTAVLTTTVRNNLPQRTKDRNIQRSIACEENPELGGENEAAGITIFTPFFTLNIVANGTEDRLIADG
jgi:hypothetical protein